MKTLYLIIFIILTIVISLDAQVKIGGTGSPDPAAVLDLDGGSDKGLLLPRHTTAEMNAMNAPNGMIIFNTTNGLVYCRRNGLWEDISDMNLGITLPYTGQHSVPNGYVFDLLNNSGDAVSGGIRGSGMLASTGVAGWSDTGKGIFGYSASGPGGFFTSNTGPALITSVGNIGFGLATPLAKIHAKYNGSSLMILENSGNLLIGARTDLNFKTGTYYTGSINTVGTPNSTARMAFSTGAHSNSGFLIERMSILNNGNVGINTITPSAWLEVNGKTKFNEGADDAAVEVNGLTLLNQLPGEEAALNVNGSIKVSGQNPAAFVVTATNGSVAVIDHPAANGNPNAIILVTLRGWTNPVYKGTVTLTYDIASARWMISSTGYKIITTMTNVDLAACGYGCVEDVEFYWVENDAQFEIGQQFNVLVIDK